ncbi:hypothetical protein CH063_07761 [Colletotrichum higginsianum]|uniref:Uncharacterized protein n=1 Tax=Colletotrichum higginsianum (strain IMI 349063) TaxID=759273 RepID=H1V7B7_COLHI|nr:hypothetical protein CH063_07761 [Colletotrichum higginsianum]
MRRRRMKAILSIPKYEPGMVQCRMLPLCLARCPHRASDVGFVGSTQTALKQRGENRLDEVVLSRGVVSLSSRGQLCQQL